jgi:hypothetical protein
MSFVIALFGSGLAVAGCPSPSSAAEIGAVLDKAQAAFGDMDGGAMGAAENQAGALLPCLAEPIDPAFAARYLRARGLMALITKQSADARALFAAARSIEPSFAFPEDIMPVGSPFWQDYNATSLDTITSQPVAVPAGRSLRVNGRPATERPGNVPFLAQWLDPDGHVLATASVPAGAPLPSTFSAPEPAKPATEPLSEPKPVPKAIAKTDKKKGGKGLPIATGVASLLVASAGLGLYSTVDGEWQRCNGLTSADGGGECLAHDWTRYQVSLGLMIGGGVGLVGSGVGLLVDANGATVMTRFTW